MLDNNYFKTELFDTENVYEIERWMTDDNYFNSANEDEIGLEAWMFNELN